MAGNIFYGWQFSHLVAWRMEQLTIPISNDFAFDFGENSRVEKSLPMNWFEFWENILHILANPSAHILDQVVLLCNSTSVISHDILVFSLILWPTDNRFSLEKLELDLNQHPTRTKWDAPFTHPSCSYAPKLRTPSNT